MNAGYIAVWLITILFILLATGWKELVADQIKLKRIVVLMIGCAVLGPFALTLNRAWLPPAGGIVHLSACWLIVWSIAAMTLQRPNRGLHSFYMIVAVLLSSLMGGWLRLLYMNDPVLIMGHIFMDAAILTGAAAALSGPIQSAALFAVVTIASVMQPILMSWFAPSLFSQPIEIGSLAWWDSYMVALLSARLMGLLIRGMKLAASKWLYSTEGEKGEREGDVRP
ncbi:hypothetical protein [Paenibacillus xylaniclasticus]|uniref:hypothetical protein n=1 Tax=Paenibacillus xylaniclasticus TaxID=588083 RepID=UPI000FDBD682|nr:MULTISPECIES: hypothetical protein [Paenibacillus]GFN30624.1 hypothetical protein PCURB6_08840 [Paenibacillus curdlanolyticus]